MRIRPSSSSCSLNALALLTASWPVIASRTRKTWCGLSCVLTSLQLAHQLVVDVQPAGGVEDDDVAAGLLRLRRSRPGRRRRRRRLATSPCGATLRQSA